MPYIGKSPVGGGFHKLDALTASATDTYSLTLGGASYFPETANQLLVSLNGVIQACQDSFTVSGSNLIFDSALTSNDSIDFVVALGDVLGVGSVTDGAITTAKIGNGAVTDAKLASTLDLSSKALTMPSGSVLQVQYTQFTGTASPAISSSTDTALTDLTVSITPTSTSSKILLQAHVMFEASVSDYKVNWMFFRDSTVLKAPVVGSRKSIISTTCAAFYDDDSSSTPSNAGYQYFDTPSTTSPITYKVGVITDGAATLYLNRTALDSDIIGYERGVSYISATEIAG